MSVNKRLKIQKPFKQTDFGKGVRTVFQAFVAAVPFIYGLLSMPEVAEFMKNQPGYTALGYAVTIFTLTYLQNKVERK